MKKTIACLAALLMLLSAWPDAFAQETGHYILENDEGTYTSIAAWDGVLYIYRASEGLYSYRPGDEQPALMVTEAGLYAAGEPLEAQGDDWPTLIGGEGVYLLANDVLWRYDDGSNRFTRLYHAGPPDPDEYGSVFEYAVVDDRLYGTALNSSGILDLIMMGEESTAQFRSGIRRIAPYRSGQLLVMTDGSMGHGLAVLDLRSNTLTEKMDLYGEPGRYIAYAPDTDTFYMWDENSLRRARGFEKMETALYLPREKGSHYQLVPLAESRVAVSYADGIFIAEADPALISVQPLKVMGQSRELPNDAFRAAYPDIPLELNERSPESLETLYADIISGSGADVYVLDAKFHDIPLMAKKGYLADLSGDSMLAEGVGGMYAYIQNTAAPEGRLTALPCGFGPTFSLMGYYPDSFAQIGLSEEDVPSTYGEFLSFIENWQNGEGDRHENMTLFGPGQTRPFRTITIWGILESEMILCARQGKPLSLNEQRVIPLLEQIGRITWEDSPSLASGGALPLPQDEQSAPRLFASYDLGLYYPPDGLRPMPLAMAPDAESVAEARLTLLAVNPNSKNREAAIRYLRTMLENLQASTRMALIPTLNEPVRDPYYDRQGAALTEAIESLSAQAAKEEGAEKRELEQRIAGLKQDMEDLYYFKTITHPSTMLCE